MLAVSLHATTDEVRREGGTEGGTEGGSGKGCFDRGVGLVPSIDRFVEESRCMLAVSLHTTTDEGGREEGREEGGDETIHVNSSHTYSHPPLPPSLPPSLSPSDPQLLHAGQQALSPLHFPPPLPPRALPLTCPRGREGGSGGGEEEDEEEEGAGGA